MRTVDVSNYMNHSCSPTCWFVEGGDEYTGLMVAAREIYPGDEITFDYCTSEDCELSPDWACQCGSANCRGRITPHDWQLPELQARYASHFLPHIAERIARALPVVEHLPTGSSPADTLPASAQAATPAPLTPPLAEVDASASWWVAQLSHSSPAQLLPAVWRCPIRTPLRRERSCLTSARPPSLRTHPSTQTQTRGTGHERRRPPRSPRAHPAHSRWHEPRPAQPAGRDAYHQALAAGAAERRGRRLRAGRRAHRRGRARDAAAAKLATVGGRGARRARPLGTTPRTERHRVASSAPAATILATEACRWP